MAHTQRTARRWLILLGALLLVFVVAVVWVIVSRNQGTSSIVQMVTNQEDAESDDGAPASDGDAQAASAEHGWFTEDQADSGADAYAQECAECHGEELEGGTGPALTGDAFWDRWEGDTVHTLFEVTSQTMPQGDPGSLEVDTYTAITAYVLQVNDFPAGEEELPAEEDRLDELVIDRSVTTEDGEAEGNGEAADGEAGTDGEETDAEAEDGEAETNGDGAEDEAETNGEAETDGEAGDAGADEAASDETADETDADEPTAEDDEQTASDEGWFADAQVQAGQTAYAESCARCHGSDLQGNPPLVGDEFPVRYQTVWELYQYVRQSMPIDHPGSLDDPTYLDVVAYVLSENGYPTGEERREPVRSVLIDMELDTQTSETTDAEEQTGEDGENGDGETENGQAEEGEPENGQAENGENGNGANGDTAEEEADSENSSDGESSDEGYYPQEQADRGEEPYAQHCAECHGDDLQGEPPLTGETFLSNHETVWDLFEYTRESMPQDDPGSLEDETYGDIVAYVLAENDFPAGGEELGPDQQEQMEERQLDAEAAEGEDAQQAADEGESEAEGEAEAGDEEADGEGDAEAEDQAEGQDAETEADDTDLPELAALEIDARPANVTINIVGPEGLARRAVGAQTLEDLQPGLYVVAAARGHESVTANVEIAAGETGRVSLVLDELSRSPDVPEDPAVPLTEVPAIPKDPDEDALIGEEPPPPTAFTSPFGEDSAVMPDEDFAAGRGQRAYAVHCSRCHGGDLRGDVAPALSGDVFFERWGGHPVDWLYFQARAAMPPHGAGFLSEQTYADIITYVLTTNDVLEGFESFTPDDEAFRTLTIEPRRTDESRPALEEQVDRVRETVLGTEEDDALDLVGPVMPVEWPDDAGIAPVGYRGRIDSAAVMEAGDLSEAGPDGAEVENDTDAENGDDGENGETTGEPGEDGDGAEPTGEPDENGENGEPGAPGDENDDPNDDGEDIGVPDAVRRPVAMGSSVA